MLLSVYLNRISAFLPNFLIGNDDEKTCSGSCYQYIGGKEGSCKWDYTTHSCGCQVTQ